MAHPASFEESNDFLSAPPGMEDFVDVLSIARFQVGDTGGILSCWKLTEEEMREVIRTGRVWVGVMGGFHPPLFVSGVNILREDRLEESADEE